MTKLNLYFFGEEQISLEDAFYFYGIQLGIVSISICSGCIALIN